MKDPKVFILFFALITIAFAGKRSMTASTAHVLVKTDKMPDICGVLNSARHRRQENTLRDRLKWAALKIVVMLFNRIPGLAPQFIRNRQ